MLAAGKRGTVTSITPKLNRFVANQIIIFQKYPAFSEKYKMFESQHALPFCQIINTKVIRASSQAGYLTLTLDEQSEGCREVRYNVEKL